MFDVLGIDGAAPVISGFPADAMAGLMSLSLELYGGGGRLLADVVTHVGGGCWEENVMVCLKEQKQAPLHM